MIRSNGFFASGNGSNQLWVSTPYSVEITTSISLQVFLRTQVVFNLNPVACWPAPLSDGTTGTDYSNFSDTATFRDFNTYDANGNLISGATVKDASGNSVPVNPVPMPSQLLAAGAGLLCFIRRGRN